MARQWQNQEKLESFSFVAQATEEILLTLNVGGKKCFLSLRKEVKADT